MKKAFSILLIVALLLSAAACSKPAQNDGSLDFSSTASPGTSEQPGATAGVNIGATAAPDVTPDPNATADPGATVDPNATPAAGATVSPGATQSPGSTATPAPSAGSGSSTDYASAHKINSDVVGWIKVPNTNINYPILYDKSGKFFYNDHDINKKNTGTPGTGSIYTVYGDVTRNIIISGHNMRVSGTMFHELHKIQDNKSNLTTRSNRVFSVKLPGFGHWNDQMQSKWEVFALYETKDSEPASTLSYNINPLSKSSKADIEKWISTQKNRSEVKLDVDVSSSDIFMTLLTCGDNYDYSDAQSRLYVFLKCVSS